MLNVRIYVRVRRYADFNASEAKLPAEKSAAHREPLMRFASLSPGWRIS